MVVVEVVGLVVHRGGECGFVVWHICVCGVGVVCVAACVAAGLCDVVDDRCVCGEYDQGDVEQGDHPVVCDEGRVDGEASHIVDVVEVSSVLEVNVVFEIYFY